MIKLSKLSPFGSFCFSFTKIFHSQSGIAPIFVVLVLVAGIIGGTYLVQQQTNLTPFAATNECNTQGRTGDESKCVKFTVTSCKPEDGKNSCDVKFEWKTASGGNIELRVTKEGENEPKFRQVAQSGRTLTLERGSYNSVIKWENGDDINPNNNDKVRFEVGKAETKTFGSYSGNGATETTTESTRNNSSSTTSSNNSSGSSANSGVHSGVPELKGNFRRGDPGDFVPKAEKQELLNRFLNPNGENGIKGKVECRNTNAQSNQGNRTGDDEKNASSLWVVADNPDGNVAKEEYIIDCSRSALGSIKSAEHEKIKCGKIKQGDSFKFGCVDTAMSSSSTSSNDRSNNSNNSSRNATGNQQQTEAPGITEKQLKDCGFSVSESGIPFFEVKVGQHTTDADAKDCEELRKAQLKHFAGIVEKAREEAAEARKNGDEKKAKELEDKAQEVEKKAAACEGKKDKEFADCAKAAAEPAKNAATAAQSQAVTNALKKLREIIDKKRPGGCVKADMGITPFLEAQRLKNVKSDGTPRSDEDRRLLLCQGKSKDDLKWRVLIGGNAGSEFADDDGVDEGNDAERIYGLHGTDPKATDTPPQYPYSVRPGGKNSFTILDPNKPGNVEEMLKDYIAAAEAGKTTLRSAPVEGDSDNNSGNKPGSNDNSKGSANFTKLNPSIAKDGAKRQLSFSQQSGKTYTCAESSNPKLKYVIVKVENDGSLAKKVEVVCDNGNDRKFVCASKSDNKELGCYNSSDLK